MTKYAAYGIALRAGTAQVETGTVVCPTGAATGTGNVTVNIVDGTIDENVVVAVVTGDLVAEIAAKLIAGILLDAEVIAVYSCYGSGADVVIRKITAAANDAALELSWTSAGLGITNEADSVKTVAGIAPVEIAAVTSITGPGLGVETVDVTSHDQAEAWEEQVATVIRSGEVTLDIVYDPADDTHDATATGGLAYRLKNRTLTWFDLIFFTTYEWTFFGYVNGFEPTGEIGGALTASVKVKIAEAPTLE